MNESYILITGASSGIGAGFAREFAKKGKPLILVARREERLRAIQREFPDVDIQVLPFDLFQMRSGEKLFEICRHNHWEVTGLINNAGLGWQKDLCLLSEEETDRMLTINLVSLTHTCRLFLQPMIQKKSGFVLNVASIAGFQALPHFSVYAATKAYVIHLSEALYEEVKGKGVFVGCLCPGPAHTEFKAVSGMERKFFTYAQNVDTVVLAGIKAIKYKTPVAYTSLIQEILCSCIGFTPRFLHRKFASFLMKLAGAHRI
ncbi:MAG: SDR family NAD(P)-dependent oxidoreductase [Verrucomicrobiota bacterium]